MDNIQMQNNRGLSSQVLDFLRFPLAIMVVIEHVIPNFKECSPDEIPFDLSNMPLFNSISDLILIFIRSHSVPIFFFISGYLFFSGKDFSKEIYIKKLKSRAKTLLIPYLIWNTFSIISLFISRIPILASFVKYPAISPNIHGFLSAFFVYDGSLVADVVQQADGVPGPINTPLWFVRNLMIAVLFAPIIYKMIKLLKIKSLVILGLLWFFLSYKFNSYAGMPTTFFFFSWGAYLSINKKDITTEFNRYFNFSIAVFAISGVLCLLSLHILPESTHYIRQINILISIVFTCNISKWLLQKGYCHVNKFLTSSSFFIYVSHSILLRYINKLFMVIFKPASDISVITVYTMIFLITISILLLTFRLLQLKFPSLLKVLTGR